MSTTAQAFARLHRLEPAQAIAYLRQRQQISLTYGWQDLWQDEHSRHFTVSRLASADLLQSLRDQISASVQGDLSRRDFLRDAKAALSQAGWWGRNEVLESASGEIHTTTFNPSRLQLIFDINTRQAHAAGQWERLQGSQQSHPYLRYITRRDERVRQHHRSWDNLTLPIGHAFWGTHFPPNGWRCRCRVVAVSQREYDRGTAPGGARMIKQAPDIAWQQWENRRSGQTETIPAGIDPGFGYNPGRSAARQQHKLVRDKLLALDPFTGAALWGTLRSTQASELQRDWQASVQRLSNTRQAGGETHLVHVISAATLQELAERGLQLASAAILMRDKELAHAVRDTKSDRSAILSPDIWARLPELIAQAVPYLDTQKQSLIYAFPLPNGRLAKIAVHLNYTEKARLSRQRQRVTANFIPSGGVVDAANMRETRYVEITK